jgi:hypothetical protein
MTTQNFKFVSYQGGSAGDLFTASANGYRIDSTKPLVHTSDSLKPYEKMLETGLAGIDDILTKFNNQYISTHLVHLLVKKHFVINVIIQQPNVQDLIVLRQMELQRLAIDVKPDQTFFKIIKNFCVKEHYAKAAEIWFLNSKNIWQQQMQHRFTVNAAVTLDFGQLFESSFVDSLVEQGWIHNTDLLRENHKVWLEKNQNFSFEKTVSTMADQLAAMNWHQKSGTIMFSAADLT